jgi:hypothetical protein
MNDRPIDHDLLFIASGPFDKGQGDGATVAGLDAFDDIGIGDRRGIALALQLKFVGGDTARDVGGEDQRDIDALLRLHRRACQQ